MNKHTRFYSRLLLPLVALGIVLAIAIIPTHPGFAQSNESNAISRGFQADDSNIVAGSLVSTKKDGSDSIELANSESANRLAGVASKALVELSSGETGEVQVLLSGTTAALVSDINGSIKAGDKITASPINGVGMLATEDGQIIGIAQSDFKSASAKSRTVKDKNGKNHIVHIGSIPLQVGISYYVAPTSQFVPPFLQQIANTIAGRPVSFMRILLSCLLLLLSFGSIFVLIYTSVRSGIVSLGRNPLAAKAIQRGLLGVIVIVVLVAILALLGIYLILTT